MNTIHTTTHDAPIDRAGMISFLRALPAACRPGQRIVSARLVGLAGEIARLLGGCEADIVAVVDEDDGDLAIDLRAMLSMLGVPCLVPAIPPDPSPTPPKGPGKRVKAPATLRSVPPASGLTVPVPAATAQPQARRTRPLPEREDELTARELRAIAINLAEHDKIHAYLKRNIDMSARVLGLSESQLSVLIDDSTSSELAELALEKIHAFHVARKQAISSRQQQTASELHAALAASARTQGGRTYLDGRILLSAAMDLPGEGEVWLALGALDKCVDRKLIGAIASTEVPKASDLQVWIEDGRLQIRHKAGKAGFSLILRPALLCEGVRFISLQDHQASRAA